MNELSAVILGSGNVATHLARALSKHITIKQIYSPNISHARQLADMLGCDATDCVDSVYPYADIYLISIKDDCIETVAYRLSDVVAASCKTPLVIHTSGSVPMTALNKKAITKYGVLYPLQTFTRQRAVDIAEVPFFTEACDPETETTISDIARLLGSNVYHADSAKRKALHIAAVFACNFTNHLLGISSDILENAGYNLDVLRPLLEVTIKKAFETSPAKAQTGPAVRGDTKVMQAHIDMLDKDNARIYEIISQSISKKHSKNNP